MSDQIPSKWAAITVEYGEKRKHLSADCESSLHFFATAAEADEWAKKHCAYDQKAIVAVLKIERLVKAAPVVFEIVNA